jgi:MFS family permease
MRLLSAFRHRGFSYLWLGQTTSRFGDRIHQVAIAWLVVELTHSALAMGTVLTAELIPTLVLLLLGGVLVDRLPRLAVILASDVLRAVIVFCIALLVIAGQITFGHLLLLGILFGTVGAFFQPAYAALVPELVPDEDRSSANGLMQLGGRAAGIAGPAVAAVLVSQGGTALALGIDALSYALSALAAIAIARRGPSTVSSSPMNEGGPPPGGSLLADLKIGFATVVEMRWIGLTVLAAGLTNISLAGPLEAVLPQLVVRHLGGDVGTYGLLNTMMSIGAAAGAVAIGRQAHLRRRGLLLYGAWVALAVMTAMLGLPVGIAGAAVAACCIGAGETILGLAWVHALQQYVPRDRLGRIYSIDALGSYALIPVGYALAGGLADVVGPATVFVVGGSISALLLIVIALHPSIRGLD